MPAEESKHTAQTAFLSMENIRDAYQQILSEGHILIGEESLTQQIAQEFFPEIDQPDIQPEIPREIDMEPER